MACQGRDEAGCAEVEEDEQERQPSLLSLVFVRKAIEPAKITSIDLRSWRRGVYDGVLFDRNTKRFWVDEKLHKNCLMVFPEAMNIYNRDKETDWRWINEKVICYKSTAEVSIPELVTISRLDIDGTLRMTGLSLYTRYEVSLEVKLSRDCNGWRFPLNFSVRFPDRSSLGSLHDLSMKRKDTWIKLVAGMFVTTPEKVGKIEYSIHETSKNPKSGFSIKGLLLEPKD